MPASGQGLPDISPFGGASNAAAAPTPKAGPDPYELVGMTVLGKETLLGVIRVKDKHSVWVPVGKTVENITAVSYDPRTDTAVIKAENQTLTVKMRKSVIVSAPATPLPRPAPMPVYAAAPPVAAPIGSPAPAGNTAAATTPAPTTMPHIVLTDAEKANEARMMVSDLLEIGQRQRQAYAEAQRQAAAARAAQGANPPPSPAPATH